MKKLLLAIVLMTIVTPAFAVDDPKPNPLPPVVADPPHPLPSTPEPDQIGPEWTPHWMKFGSHGLYYDDNSGTFIDDSKIRFRLFNAKTGSSFHVTMQTYMACVNTPDNNMTFIYEDGSTQTVLFNFKGQTIFDRLALRMCQDGLPGE